MIVNVSLVNVYASVDVAVKMYSKKLLKYFKNPKHAGNLKNADGVGQVGNPTCGDIMKVYIKVKDGKIDKIRVQTMGCVAAISSSEALAEMVEGKKIKDALKITQKDVIKKLGGMPGEKIHCSVLAQKALKKAIEDYKSG